MSRPNHGGSVGERRENANGGSGSAVSVIGEQTYQATWPQAPPELQPTAVKLRTYSGEELQVLGSIPVHVIKIKAIQEAPKPHNITQLKSFL